MNAGRGAGGHHDAPPEESTGRPPRLAYVEHCLPGAEGPERLERLVATLRATGAAA